MPSLSTGALAAEFRNETTREVSFYSYFWESASWHLVAQSSHWWTAIWTCTADYLVLHGYAAPDWPVKQGVAVWSVNSQALVWKNEEVQPVMFSSTALWVREKTGELSGVDLKTGVSLGSVIPDAQKEDMPLSVAELINWTKTGGAGVPLSFFRLENLLVMAGPSVDKTETHLQVWLGEICWYQAPILPAPLGFEQVMLAGRRVIFNDATGQLSALSLPFMD